MVPKGVSKNVVFSKTVRDFENAETVDLLYEMHKNGSFNLFDMFKRSEYNTRRNITKAHILLRFVVRYYAYVSI